MSSEKFGKVFLKDDGTDQERDIITSWRELPFACFSNSDFIWYGVDGDVHHQFKKFIGHPISLGFKITTETEEKETFFGRLNLAYNLGECDIKRVQNSRPFPVDNPAFQRLTKVDHLDILLDYLMPAASPSSLSSDGHGEGKLLYYVLISVFCESLKNRSVAQRIKLPHKQIALAMKQYTDSVLGVNSTGPAGIASLLSAAMINPAMLRSIKLSEMRTLQTSYDLMSQIALRLRKEAMEICGENEELLQPLLKSILSTTHQGGLENCQEFRDMDSSTQLLFLEEVKYDARGYQIVLETVALETGITVKVDIRETYLFKKFIYHFVVQMGKIQDIFSTGSSWSASESLSGSFLEVMANITQQANDNLRKLLVVSDLLVKLYDDNNDVTNENGEERISSYVSLAKRIICGFIQWQTFRHPQLVFDCYVG